MRAQLFTILLSLLPLSLIIGQPQLLLDRAHHLYTSEEYDESLSLLENFVNEFPTRKYDVASAYYLMSANFLNLRQFEGAIWANQKSLELRNNLRADEVIENCLRFSEIYYVQGRYETALEYLQQAVDLPFQDPKIFAEINKNLGRLMYILGKYEEARTYYYRTSQILKIEFGEDYELLPEIYVRQARLALCSNDIRSARMYLLQTRTFIENSKIRNPYPLQGALYGLLLELGSLKYPSEATATTLREMFINTLYLLHGTMDNS